MTIVVDSGCASQPAILKPLQTDAPRLGRRRKHNAAWDDPKFSSAPSLEQLISTRSSTGMAAAAEAASRRAQLRTWPSKPDVFIMFADLDGTFTPMDLQGKIEFVSIIKEIKAREGCTVKFVPVSGRPAGYVLRILHDCRDMLKGENIVDCCEFGAAEQGALIVDSAKSYGPKFTGYPENIHLKEKVAGVIAKHVHKDIVVDEPDKLYTCSVHIKNEIKANMTNDQKMDVYRSVRDAVSVELGQSMDLSLAMSHNCLEVMTAEISKAYAIKVLLQQYAKTYNVVGCLYGGDAENDKVAMKYVSKLSEIPGIRAHNFTPGNAQESISTIHVDDWKHKNKIPARGYVEKAVAPLFKGVAELIRKAMDAGRLCDRGIVDWRTRDDSLAAVHHRHPQHQSDISARLDGLDLACKQLPRRVTVVPNNKTNK